MDAVNQEIRVVIAVGNNLFRQGLLLILSGLQGIETVGEANNGIKAIDVITDQQPDIVLLDFNMPMTNGLELLPLIRQKSPKTNTLIISGFPDEKSTIDALEAGAKGYLSKNADVLCLFNAINVLKEGEMWVERKLIAKYFDGLLPACLKKKTGQENIKNALTPREQEVLILLVEGLTNKQIGIELFICEKTVKSHLSRIFKKLNVKQRIEAILCALKMGFC
ncbi:MAG: two-component system response regulator DegU [Desulforhopalus sp.]|jgi:two-component system response regulator DegU